MFNFRPDLSWLYARLPGAAAEPPGFGVAPSPSNIGAMNAPLNSLGNRLPLDEEGTPSSSYGIEALPPFADRHAFPYATWPLATPSLEELWSGPGLHHFRSDTNPGLHLFRPEPEPGLYLFRPDAGTGSGTSDPASFAASPVPAVSSNDEDQSVAASPSTTPSDDGDIGRPWVEPTPFFVLNPIRASMLPPGRIQDALDEIARLYVTDNSDSAGVDTTYGREHGNEAGTFADGTFDPRFVIPVAPPPGPGRPAPPPARGGTPQQQQPKPSAPAPSRGTGDNKGPPLEKEATPPAGAPPSTAPTGQPQRPTVGPQPVPDQAGPAAAAGGRRDTSADTNPDPRSQEAWSLIAKVATGDAPDPEYGESDGQRTGVGIFIDRRLPEPAAGWNYNPPPGHLRTGYVGEIKLANRIVTALKDEVVVHFGMPAGMRGPDVTSVGPDGTIRVWDSKSRTLPARITRGGHEKAESLERVARMVEEQIERAIESGRLPPDVAAKARENAKNGNFFVITVGTGNAHGGVVRSVQNHKYSDSGSK